MSDDELWDCMECCNFAIQNGDMEGMENDVMEDPDAPIDCDVGVQQCQPCKPSTGPPCQNPGGDDPNEPLNPDDPDEPDDPEMEDGGTWIFVPHSSDEEDDGDDDSEGSPIDIQPPPLEEDEDITPEEPEEPGSLSDLDDNEPVDGTDHFPEGDDEDVGPIDVEKPSEEKPESEAETDPETESEMSDVDNDNGQIIDPEEAWHPKPDIEVLRPCKKPKPDGSCADDELPPGKPSWNDVTPDELLACLENGTCEPISLPLSVDSEDDEDASEEGSPTGTQDPILEPDDIFIEAPLIDDEVDEVDEPPKEEPPKEVEEEVDTETETGGCEDDITLTKETYESINWWRNSTLGSYHKLTRNTKLDNAAKYMAKYLYSIQPQAGHAVWSSPHPDDQGRGSADRVLHYGYKGLSQEVIGQNTTAGGMLDTWIKSALHKNIIESRTIGLFDPQRVTMIGVAVYCGYFVAIIAAAPSEEDDPEGEDQPDPTISGPSIIDLPRPSRTPFLPPANSDVAFQGSQMTGNPDSAAFVTFIADRSQSTKQNAKWFRIQSSILKTIESMSGSQKFRIFLFNESYVTMSSSWSHPNSWGTARGWLATFFPEGGTDPRGAVREALLYKPSDGLSHVVFFLSDGEFTAPFEASAFTTANKYGARIHTFYFDDSARVDRMKSIAELNGGTANRMN